MKAKVIKTGEIVDVYHESQHGQITNIYKEYVLVNGRMWTEDELDFCMEANEAPEKLYVDTRDNLSDYMLYGFTEKSTDEDIEYTRTDVFIEKACEFLKSYRQDTFDGVGYIAGIVNDETIEDFRKYMEGA